MPISAAALRALLVALAAIAALLPGLAAGSGDVHPGAWASAAFARAGPGNHHPVVGVLRAGQPSRVERCQGDWCHVVTPGGTLGWVHVAYLNEEGRIPGPFSGPRLEVGRGGPGRVCFHDGENYTGHTVCHASGFVARDLADYGLDNRFRSISIEGNVSANVCRDPDFRSYCVLYHRSVPRLGPLHRGAISSYRVW